MLIVGVFLAVALVTGVIGLMLFAAPPYRGPVSDHFDGRRFRNQERVPMSGFGQALRWWLLREPGPWRPFIEAPPGPKPPLRVGRGQMRVTFVNHATALIQMDGLNILTDPILSERASPVSFAGPRRAVPPGLRFEDLPPIDVVLVSHNHYDHLDLPTLRRLADLHRPRIFSGLGNKALLDQEEIAGAADLDWWQSAPLAPELSLTAVPAQHWSNRGIPVEWGDRDRTLWTGFVVQGPAGAVYFPGDTGYGPHIAEIRRRFGPIRLALLPIGAYLPAWFMSPAHLSPAEAVRAHQALEASTSVAIHFGTFQLGDDGQDQPLADLALALEKAGRPRFWVLGFGEGRDVPEVVVTMQGGR